MVNHIPSKCCGWISCFFQTPALEYCFCPICQWATNGKFFRNIWCWVRRRRKHIKNQGNPWCSPQVVDIWLLVWITYGNSLTCGLFLGLACFFILFLFLILSHCIFFQLLTINGARSWGGNSALLFVALLYCFFIIFYYDY